MDNFWLMFMKSLEFFRGCSKYTKVDRTNHSISMFADSSALVALCRQASLKYYRISIRGLNPSYSQPTHSF